MSPETRAAIDRLHASGLIAAGIEAVRVDHYYAAAMVREHHRLEGMSQRAMARHAGVPA